jgi:transposase-like protein
VQARHRRREKNLRLQQGTLAFGPEKSQAGVEVSDLCRREGINPTQYYGWKKQLLSSATKIFDASEVKRNSSEERKEAEVRRMKDVIAEITAENLELKKGLSG